MSDKQTKVIKEYLETQCISDSALRAAYDPAKIDDCFQYIRDQAKKVAENNCAFVENEVVFKWARDFYLEHEEPKAEQKEIKIIADGTKYDKDGNGLLFDLEDE